MSPEDIDALFLRLGLVYGMGKLEATYKGQDIGQVKAAWTHELRSLTTSDIAYGMTCLPAQEWPPNVLEFKALAKRNAPKPFPRLEAPHATTEHREQAIAALRGLAATLTDRSNSERCKGWAWKLKALEEAGEVLHYQQRCMWREALARELGEYGGEV